MALEPWGGLHTRERQIAPRPQGARENFNGPRSIGCPPYFGRPPMEISSLGHPMVLWPWGDLFYTKESYNGEVKTGDIL